jgi:hypothetical protein
VDALLVLLEGSALGVLIRQAGVWSYALINLGHVAGVAMLFGAVLLLDLRLIGVWPQVPLAAVSIPADRLAQVGFAIAVTAGICMLATNGSEYVGNPLLRIKFAAIGAGLLNTPVLRGRNRPRPSLNRRPPNSFDDRRRDWPANVSPRGRGGPAPPAEGSDERARGGEVERHRKLAQ